jgi:hypothetical protein
MRSGSDAMSVTPAHPEPGPLHTELLLYGFAPGCDFEGRLVGALERLESGGALRIIEVVFVHRDAATNELAAIDIPGDGAGGIAGPLLGFRLDAGDRARATKRAFGERPKGVPGSTLRRLGERLEPGGSVAGVLIRHVWRATLEDAVARTGGTPVVSQFVATAGATDRLGSSLEAAVDSSPPPSRTE